ncbi:Nucleoporin NSP1 [Hanseniaspora osmophila]|uniref:Nucleoporin NSP1 n=1 Tax=Hanseniaspora osmophila TaxID=56408 RepID=A0A1E5R2U3_9ASCO|nr:Nucleoporin NSP1 [Hanseniaspora osmophila]
MSTPFAANSAADPSSTIHQGLSKPEDQNNNQQASVSSNASKQFSFGQNTAQGFSGFGSANAAAKPNIFAQNQIVSEGKKLFGATATGAPKESSAPASLNLGSSSGTSSLSAFAKPAGTAAEPAKSGFTFNLSNEKKGAFEKPIFDLNSRSFKPAAQVSSTSTTPANTVTDKKDEPAKSGFAFGGSEKTAEPAKPAFAFGGSEKTAEPAKPAFAFGGSEKTAEPAKPAFAFGGSEKTAEPAKPAFAFGGSEKTAEPAKPAFAFGGSEKTAEPAKPAFAFGGSEKTAEPAKPAKPAFAFGGPEKTAEPAKPAFAFGGSEKTAEPAKPAFAFGGSEKTAEPAKPAFAFDGSEKKKETLTPAKQSGFQFGAKTAEKVEENNKPAGNNSGAPPAKTETVTTTNPASVVQLPTQAPEINLDNKTLDDLVSKWARSLDTSYSHFDAYLGKVNEWDRVLVDGGEKISKLYSDALMAEQTQNRIEQSLQYIERQQTDLEVFLNNFEQKTEKLLSDISPSAPSSSNTTGSNDEKRKQAHQTALQLDDNLNSLSANLASLTEEINEVSENFTKNSQDSYNNKEEGVQIIKLLNSHLDALNALSTSSDSLEQKLKTLGK